MKTKTWKILLSCLIGALLFAAHIAFVINDELPEGLISEHIDYQLNQNSRLVLTYYKPPYGGVYTEIAIKSIDLPHVGEVNTLQMGVMSLE